MAELECWRTAASRYVIRDNWIAVRADDCVTGDGTHISPYYVLEYPDWVHIVALDPDGQVVLVEQYRHGLNALSLEIPAGRIDASDDGPAAAGLRELLEETGCTGDLVAVLPALSPNPATHSNRIHTIVLRNVHRVQSPVDDPQEVIKVRRVSVDEAIRAATSGEMMASLQIPSLLLGLRAAGALTLNPPGGDSRS